MTRTGANGFEGLAAMATDVDGALAASNVIASRPAPVPAPVVRTDRRAVHRDGGTFTAGTRKAVGWIVGIGVVLAIKAAIWGGVHAVSGGGSAPASTTISSSDQPHDWMADVEADQRVADPAQPTIDATPAIEGDAPASTAEDAASPSVDDETASRPAPGYATLTIEEVRYCLAEDVRVAAQKARMDSLQTEDVDRFNRNVDDFNETVGDYNDRCANRMASSADRIAATSRLETMRARLEAEGRDRVD